MALTNEEQRLEQLKRFKEMTIGQFSNEIRIAGENLVIWQARKTEAERLLSETLAAQAAEQESN